MGVSTFEADQRLNTYRGTDYPADPASFYVSLHSADPGVTGAFELTGNGYARVAISAATGSWAAPSTVSTNRVISNAVAVTFPTATGDWTTATHFGLWDAPTSGNFRRGAALTASKTVQNTDTASFAIGELVLREALGS